MADQSINLRINATAAGAAAEMARVEASLKGMATAAATAGKNMKEAFEGADANVVGLKDAFDSAGAAQEAFRTLGVKAVRDLDAEVAKLREAVTLLRSQPMLPADAQAVTAQFQKRLAELRTEAGQLPPKLSEASSAVRTLGDASGEASTRMASAARAALGWVAAFAGFNSLADTARNVINTGAAFETLERRLTSMLGSQQAAQQAFGQIKELARTTPFEVSALTEAYAKLTAFGLQPSMEQMMALADTAATLGGGTEALAGVTLALGQAWTKGKLQGEELLQLAERGVPVWDVLAQITGRNTEELQKMAAAGELGRGVILQLIDALGQTNAGASAELMASFSGAVSNAKDAVAEFYDLISQAGVLDYLTGRIQSMLAEFDRLRETGDLQRWAQDISDSMITVATAIEAGIEAMGHLAGAIEAGIEAMGHLAGAAEVLLKVFIANRIITYGNALFGLGAAGASAVAGTTAAAGAIAATTAAATRAIPVLTLLRRLTMIGIVVTGIEAIGALVSRFVEARKSAEEAKRAMAEASRITQTAGGDSSAVAEERARQELVAKLAAHKDRVLAIKNEELNSLKQVLNAQVKAYDEATKGIEAALKRQEAAAQRTKDIVEANKQFTAGLGQNRGDQKEPSIVDVGGATAAARTKLSRGDLDGAIQEAERAKKIVGDIDKAGTESVLVLQGLMREISRIQQEASTGLEAEAANGVEKEKARAEEIQKLITETVAKAEYLKMLEVAFDQTKAEQSADELRAALEAKLASNPIVIPAVVVDQGTKMDSRVEDLVGDIPARAWGGPLPGVARHDRSDNMLYLGTPGEWVIQRPAVRRLKALYGDGVMRLINAGRLPRYAFGGELSGAGSVLSRMSMPSLPRSAEPTASTTPVVLDFGQLGRYTTSAAPSVANEIIKTFQRAALQRGRR